MYKLYRKLLNNNWKYVETYNSTLDPNYNADIYYLNDNKIEWELRDSNGNIKFSNIPYEEQDYLNNK
jgi:hypothetical protein